MTEITKSKVRCEQDYPKGIEYISWEFWEERLPVVVGMTFMLGVNREIKIKVKFWQILPAFVQIGNTTH